MVSCGKQIALLLSLFSLGILIAALAGGVGRGGSTTTVLSTKDIDDIATESLPTDEFPAKKEKSTTTEPDNIPVVTHKANQSPSSLLSSNSTFDPRSPIYVSQNVNVSYSAGGVVIPFQFRKGFKDWMDAARREGGGGSGGSPKFVIDPHRHIFEGRQLAADFMEFWKRLGKAADFPKVPYSEFGAPFWIENVKKKLRIKLREVEVRPLLGQVIKRDEVTKSLLAQSETSGSARPDQQVLLPKEHKRLMLDVGARQFQGSPQWLGRYYTEAKTFDFVAFELLDLQDGYKEAGKYFKTVRYIQKAGWTHNKGVNIKGVRMAKVVDGENEPIPSGEVIQGLPVRPPAKKGPTFWNAPSVDLAAFIKQEATPEDFVVMKLDIEGGEWQLLQHLVNEGVIPYYIDEIMMECHAKDPNTYALLGYKLLPPECMDLITDLREMGVYTHRWV